MKDYYHIMGLKREASEVEIKHSFRKLAVLYHPDRNPSRDAEQIFKEINEAYEVLSDPTSRLEYDQRLANTGFYTLRDSQPWQRDPAHDAGRAAYQRRSTSPSERTLFMLSMLKFTQVLFYFGCMWCAALLVDYAMPSRVQEEIVVSDLSLIPKLQLIRNYRDLLVTDRGHHFPLGVAEMKYFPFGTPIRIYSSNLFSALIRVENYNGSFVINNLGTIYRNFSFAPILMFISCLAGLVVKKGIEFHVNLGIVIFLLMILNIIFLFSSRI